MPQRAGPAKGKGLPGYFMLLTSDPHIRERIDQQTLLEFVGLVESAIEAYFAEREKGLGMQVQVSCAVLPENKRLIEIEVQPPDVSAALLAGLKKRIEELPWPSTRKGPVAFVRRSLVWGGAGRSFRRLNFPFASLFREQERPVSLDDVLMQAAGLTHERQSAWTKFISLLGLR